MPKNGECKESTSQTGQSHCAQLNSPELTWDDVFSNVLNNDVCSIVMGYLPKLDVIYRLAHGSNQAYYPLYAKLLLTDEGELRPQTLKELFWSAIIRAKPSINVANLDEWVMVKVTAETTSQDNRPLQPSSHLDNQFAEKLYEVCDKGSLSGTAPFSELDKESLTLLQDTWMSTPLNNLLPLTRRSGILNYPNLPAAGLRDWNAASSDSEKLVILLEKFAVRPDTWYLGSPGDIIGLMMQKLPELFHARRKVTVEYDNGEIKLFSISQATIIWIHCWRLSGRDINSFAWITCWRLSGRDINSFAEFARYHKDVIARDFSSLMDLEFAAVGQFDRAYCLFAYLSLCEMQQLEAQNEVEERLIQRVVSENSQALAGSDSKSILEIVRFFFEYRDAGKSELMRYLNSRQHGDKQAFLNAIYNYKGPRDSSEELNVCDFFLETVDIAHFALSRLFVIMLAFSPFVILAAGLYPFCIIFCFSSAVFLVAPPVIGAVACSIYFLVRWVKAVNAPMYQDAKQLIKTLEQENEFDSNPLAPQ